MVLNPSIKVWYTWTYAYTCVCASKVTNPHYAGIMQISMHMYMCVYAHPINVQTIEFLIMNLRYSISQKKLKYVRCGTVTVLCWCGRSTLLVRSWCAHGSLLVRSWYAHGSLLVRSWYALGTLMVCSRVQLTNRYGTVHGSVC